MARRDIEVLRMLLMTGGGKVRPADFAQAREVSRQRASLLLRQLADRELLRRRPEAPPGEYVAGPALAELSSAERRRWDGSERRIWTELERHTPGFRYVRLERWGQALRTRAQARFLAETFHDRSLLVLDLVGVTALGVPFLHELGRLLPGTERAFINAGEHASVLALASLRDPNHWVP